MGIIKNAEATGPTSELTLYALSSVSSGGGEFYSSPAASGRGQMDKRSQRETLGDQGWVPWLGTSSGLLDPPLSSRYSLYALSPSAVEKTKTPFPRRGQMDKRSQSET